ncbi:MAG: flippase-like domain-containing protein [Candidatus Kapabacteria bacterium]|nr:flippase-like domain-containing protein [Candidatus Kapabacteria bacterium]
MDSLKKNIVRFGLTLLILCVAMWWVFSKIDIRQLGEAFLRADYTIVVLTIPVVLASHFLRAWRWRTLLRPVQPAPSLWNLYSAVMVGYAANNIIPRSGEFLRPFVYSKRTGLPLTTTVASVVVERFIDVLNLLLFIAIAMYFVGNDLSAVMPDIETATRSAALLAAILLVVIVFITFTNIGEWAVRRMIAPAAPAAAEKVIRGLATFKKGLSIVSTPSEYIRLIGESCLIWLFYIIPMYMMLHAMILNKAYVFTFFDASLLLLVMAVGTTLAPTPGAIGVVHYLVPVVMMQLYQVPKEDGLAYVALTHGVNFLSVTITGGLFMLRENVRPHIGNGTPAPEPNTDASAVSA